MKKTILFLSFFVITGTVLAQPSTTTSAVITFDATTPKDKQPKAENKTVIGSLNKTTGALLFEAAVNNFSFSSSLMQKHFNSDKWLNSEAFPKFTFSGKIDKLTGVKFTTNGTYNVTVTGNLVIKGVTKAITVPATIIVKDGTVTSSSAFSVKLSDYNINGQPVESGKVSTEPKITVSATF